MPLDVAVQIVNYRTKDHLGPCLQAVADDLRDAGFAHRTFVLDNASGDDLRDVMSAHPESAFHTTERNLGFGAGHNRLAGAHDAAAIVLLNPDSLLVEPTTIARLRALLDDPAVAGAGPQLVSPDGRVEGWDHGELGGWMARLAASAGHSHSRERSTRTDVAWVSGAAAIVARRWFDAVGGFDPGFFLYKEEEDLFLRMRGQGARVVYEPAIRVRHDGEVTGVRAEHLEASVRRFRDKHVTSPVRRAVMPAVHRQVVAWDGRMRRARSLVRRDGRSAS